MEAEAGTGGGGAGGSSSSGSPSTLGGLEGLETPLEVTPEGDVFAGRSQTPEPLVRLLPHSVQNLEPLAGTDIRKDGSGKHNYDAGGNRYSDVGGKHYHAGGAKHHDDDDDDVGGNHFTMAAEIIAMMVAVRIIMWRR